MNLLLLYTKNEAEVFDRKSAIGSYIHCLSSILSKAGITVFLNGSDLQVDKTQIISRTEQSSNNIIKKMVPKVFKRAIRDYKQLKNTDKLTNRLSLNDRRFDAVLEFYNFGSQVGLSISKELGIPLYITYDSPILEEYEVFNNAQPFFKKIFLKRELESLLHAKKIIVYSNPMKKHIVEKVGPNAHVQIHQNVDFTRFDILENSKDYSGNTLNICFIGSFLLWHQVDLLVKVFSKLIKENFDIQLFLVGDGLERKNIQKLVSQYSTIVQEKIEFTGFLDGKQLFDLKKEMHIGVMPGSNWYGAPNKIFEYGAMKMAVIAPDTPTIKDLFSKQDISFFDWRNEDSLYEVLKNMVQNPEFVQINSLKLHKVILNRYSEKKTLEFYNEILRDNPST